jgi:hypothetical protein
MTSLGNIARPISGKKKLKEKKESDKDLQRWTISNSSCLLVRHVPSRHSYDLREQE